MKNYIKLTFLTVTLTSLVGCASVHDKYKETGWVTPDGFNYTYATDSELKPDGHWFGLSWTLK